MIMTVGASAAQAACTGVVAGRLGALRLVAAGPGEGVSITFLGHASFLIESPGGVRIVTDYNDAIRAPVIPDIVTMNNAHPTHYSDSVEPGVKYILRGWDPAGGVASHRLEYRDVRIHNVPTNVREFGGTDITATRFLCSTSPICASPISAICTIS
jgi:L-ascorbate metabolism protein UlaG (beta-lactamase superfamily)